ncbi:putative serine/threonine-protein kinase [Citricoccus zhacaiensis]|uniref:non-specific serine/threonine protein kinase n=1 Tax=Citricoccus zhacaiensis TaxID=489142 RepID=A0ABQ2LWB9_9MICC|nr:Stk1 family PASTA domain-containing Ser/Thr kinase [Citricoccus zhacaiensis]GGO43008.1 putative serine/threonine-protein kinase [Citricoccus zhacaiensis]
MPHQRILNGRYEVGDLIGRGGMADVFQGRDQKLGRKVAIKLMRPDLARDPQFQSRFRREAQSSAALNHPNIVSVFDTGEERFEDGAYQGVACPFMVMEFVDGRTLRDLLRHDDVTVDQAIEWTSGVLAALNYSHEEGIVHRDIKPANIMVTKSGAVKVMDFGIARALSDSAATMTQTQAVVGTAQYLSPEQARGESVDSRSDLYSAGCLLFELLTGRPPFVGDSAVAVAYQHVREEPPVPSTLNPTVSPALDSVVSRALSKDREDRFQSGLEFRASLNRAAEQPDAGPAQHSSRSAAAGDRSGGVADASAGSAAGSAAGAAAGAAAVGRYPDGATEAMTAVPPRPEGETRAMAAVGNDSGSGPGTERYTGFPGDRYSGQQAGGLSAPTAATPPAPPENTRHPLDLDDEPRPGGPPKKRKAHRVWVPILVVILALGAVAGGWFLMEELNRRTVEANQVTVPSVAEMTQIEAQNALTSAELRPILEEVHDDEIQRDLAVGTEPASGTVVQKNQEITLLISIGPEQVEIPADLAGQSEATARDTLEGLGLSISSVRYVPSADVPRDRLVGTSPELGATVRSGSSVELQMSSGNVGVPNLVGLTREEAQAALQDLGLQMTVSEVEREAPVEPGTVVGQEQPEGTEVPQDSSVTVEVAKAPEEPSTSPSPSSESPSGSPSPSDSASGSPSESPSPSESSAGASGSQPTGPGNNRGRGQSG